jgi:hypothetical protein
MENFYQPPIRANPIVDVKGRMQKPPDPRPTAYRSSHERELLKQVNVAEERLRELFCGSGVALPGPLKERLQVL